MVCLISVRCFFQIYTIMWPSILLRESPNLGSLLIFFRY